MYLFPCDCPRILIWATEQTNGAHKMKWLAGYRAAAYIEHERLPDLAAATPHHYDLPTDTFEDLHDAGMWVSRVAVEPLSCGIRFDLPSTFAPRGVDLRVVDSLLALKSLRETTLRASGIGLPDASRWRVGRHLVAEILVLPQCFNRSGKPGTVRQLSRRVGNPI